MTNTHAIKLGLFSYSYHLAFGAHDVFKPSKKINFFDFLDKCKYMGLDGIQIDAMHLESFEDSYINKIIDRCNEYGFYIEYGVTGVSEEHLLTQLEIAKKFGSAILRTYIGFDPSDKNINPGMEIKEAIRVLNIVKVKAEEYNIKIAIENHCDLKTDELIALIQSVNSPFVGVCVDLGNFMIHLENPVDSVRKLAPYIVNTHLKDYNSKMENWGFQTFGVACGDGKIDLRAIVKILLEECHLDRIMLELPVQKEATEEATLAKEDLIVRKSVKYCREVLGL
jgi:sugar phosphate isomerase/epimerase